MEDIKKEVVYSNLRATLGSYLDEVEAGATIFVMRRDARKGVGAQHRKAAVLLPYAQYEKFLEEGRNVK